MKRMSWIILDLIMATIVAVLGNIVASYLQERFELTAPARFVFVAFLFVTCLGVLLYVTLKRSRVETGHQDGETDQRYIRMQQRVRDIESEGRIVGLESEELRFSTPISVEQEADRVAGEMAGIRIGSSDETRLEDDEERRSAS